MIAEFESLKDKLKKLYLSLDDNDILLGWQFTQVTNTALRFSIDSIIRKVEEIPSNREISEFEQSIAKQFCQGIDTLINGSAPHYNQNSTGKQAGQAAILQTLQQLRFFIEDISPKWISIDDPEVLPEKLAKKIKSANSNLQQLEPELNSIKDKLELLSQAEKINSELPLELEELENARKKLDLVNDEAAQKINDITNNKDSAEEMLERIEILQEQGNDFIKQLSALHRIGTSTALAGAFHTRANELNKSVYVWGGILVTALIIALFIGSYRLNELNTLLASETPAYKIWIMAFFSILGVGAPIWIAWIATKQVGQRFRLAEDYAYKASVSNAYEGYRREARHFDNEAFEAKLFGTALDRLDEVPLRLVERETHGSPMHEFLNSPVFQKHLETPGELKDAFMDFLKRTKSSGKS